MYPEVSPFLFLAFVLYVAAGLLQRGLAVGKLMIGAGTAFITWVVLLNSYWLIAVGYIAGAVETSSRSVRVDPASEMMGTESLFPYFLVPGGLADFWGFQSIADFPSEPWMSASIALGAILFFLSIPVIAWQLWKRQPSAFVVFAMLVASVIFFRRHEGFALFKLSMFIQPFLLGTIATFWTALSRRKIWQVAPIVVLAMIGVHTQVFYVDASYKTARGKLIFAEIPQASLSRVYSEFEHAVSSANAQQLVLDTPNLVLSKVQTLYTRGKSTFNLGGIFNGYPLYPKSLFLDQATKDKVDSIARQLQARNRTLSFSLLDPSDPAARNPFVVFGNPAASGNGNECEHLIIAGRQHSVFNQSHPGGSGFVSQPCGNVRNHLVFVNSKLGQIHYFDSRDAAFYKPESDYFFADRYFSAVGRHLLFRVINPSEKVRLVLNLSRTLNGDGKNLLPPAAAVGSTREPFPLEGRGSGRVFSPPLQPQIIEGRAYLAIDLGVSGTRFPSARTGLMNLYGTGVQFDIRRPVAFARDISLISEEEYQRLTPPGRLQKFPDDLANPDLEYSGLYEDGWVSESAFVYLTQPEAADCLSIQGMTQAADTTIQILIDGRVIKNQRLTSGLFRLRIPVPRGKGKKRIELHFSEVNRLGEADSRPAAARLKSLGFEEASRREQAGASRLLPD
ncbi:MAG TPA: hypothetical protein VFD58_20520 [Blastocatellia bacterium]|nr:hypothetical protein [Blastocatellia bacterium]